MDERRRWEVTLTTKVIVYAPTLQEARDIAIKEVCRKTRRHFDTEVKSMWPTDYPVHDHSATVEQK